MKREAQAADWIEPSCGLRMLAMVALCWLLVQALLGRGQSVRLPLASIMQGAVPTWELPLH